MKAFPHDLNSTLDDLLRPAKPWQSRMINFFGIVHQCGGCGTEILGAIELLRSRKVPVRMIVPPGDPIIDHGNPAADYLRDKLGVTLVQYTPGMFKECQVLMSFGEGVRLFPLIRENNDRPGYFVYSDCMHYATDDEIAAHREGLIDEFFFQSRALADKLGPIIARRAHKAVKARSGYKAFINTKSRYLPLRFRTERDDKTFRALKICRDDPDKWHPDTWRMFCGVTAPAGASVQIEIAGFGPEAAAKVGDPTATDNSCKWHNELNVTLHQHIHDSQTLSELYARSHVLVHVCDYQWEEALGRIMLEAQAAGVVVIADNRGGAKELITDKETGFLVDSPDEAAFRASELAFYPNMRRAIASQAYAQLVTTGHGNPDACWPWWADLLKKTTNGHE